MRYPLLILLLCAGHVAGCYHRDLDNYRAQQAAAEKRAAAFKEAGHWTPTAMRRFSKSLKSGAVVPQEALAEMGIVVLDDLSVSTVRAAVDSVAARTERAEKNKP